MKQKNKIKRLERRIKGYEALERKDAYTKSGSFRR